MSKKKSRKATAHELSWLDGPICIEVEGVADGSEERYKLHQDKSCAITQYTPVNLHLVTKSDKPCINYITDKRDVLNFVVITAHKPAVDGGEHCINRIASDLFSKLSGEDTEIYGNALFLPAPWIFHYPPVMFGYLGKMIDQGMFNPETEV